MSGKPELYSRSYSLNQNFFSLKLLKLIGLCTVRQISIIQAFTDSNWQPPKCYRMSKIFFVPVPIWSSSCNPSDTIFRILPHAKKKVKQKKTAMCVHFSIGSASKYVPRVKLNIRGPKINWNNLFRLFFNYRWQDENRWFWKCQQFVFVFFLL